MDYLLGLDVSHHNVDDRGSPIDWPLVKAAGFGFVLVKATDGLSFVDPKFEASLAGAKEAGLLTGAYHFLRPGDDAGLQGEKYLEALSSVGGLKALDLLPAVDAEDPSDEPGAWLKIDRATRILKVEHWCAAVEAEVKAPSLLYTNTPWWRLTLGAAPFGSHPLWASRYSANEPDLSGTPWEDAGWTIWQYSESGVVPGIGHGVDLNRVRSLAAIAMPRPVPSSAGEPSPAAREGTGG